MQHPRQVAWLTHDDRTSHKCRPAETRPSTDPGGARQARRHLNPHPVYNDVISWAHGHEPKKAI